MSALVYVYACEYCLYACRYVSALFCMYACMYVCVCLCMLGVRARGLLLGGDPL